MQEMLEDMVLRRDELVAALEEGDKNLDRKRALAQIDSLNEALGEPRFTEDALIDEWERQLEADELPDLEM
jgi:hypothetical protein